MKRKRNPPADVDLADDQELAEQVSAGFHGRDAQETFEVREQEVYRQNLPLLGVLLDMEVFNENLNRRTPITLPFEDVMLAGSSDRRQLYLVGDTSLPDDWLQEASPAGWNKDKVQIGYCYGISYKTDKHHLTGPKSQERGAEYEHSFGEQTMKAPANYDGVWKLKDKLVMGLLPVLVYNRLSGQIEIIGGVYEIKDEGIWD